MTGETSAERPDRWALPAFLAVFVLAAAFHLHYVRGVSYAFRADEGHYLAYADAVATSGIGVLPGLVRDYVDAGSGTFPPPTRLGWILPSAVALKVGRGDPVSIAYLSTAFLGGAVLVVFAFLSAHVRGRTAFLAATLVAFSPLFGGMARRILQDAEVAFLTVAAAFCFYQALKSASSLFAATYGLLLAWLLVTKEAGVYLLPVLAGYAAWWRLRVNPRGRIVPVVAATAGGLAAAAAVYVLLCGSVGGVVRLGRVLLDSQAKNAYLLAYSAGPWFRYLVDLASLSAAAVVLAAGFSFHHLVSKRRAGSVEGFLIALLVGILASYSLTIRNVRFVLAAEIPLRALAAFGLVALADAWPRRGVALALGAAVLGALANDVAVFHRVFVEGRVYDPVTDGVLRALEMLPG